MANQESLLRPVLEEHGQARAVYSTQGFFFTSMFGGPLGAVIYCAFNSTRLRRFPEDALLLALFAVAFPAIIIVMNQTGLLAQLAAMLAVSGGRSRTELVFRGLGLVYFGLLYFRHRVAYRNADMAGIEPKSGWVPGLVGFVAGVLADMGLIYWLTKAGGSP